MKKIYLLVAVVFALISCQVQNSTKSNIEKPLFTIEDETISSEDFKYAFLKNYRPNDSLTIEEDVKEYLDLYIKFKLKVKEARALGYADRQSYKDELEKYQKDLAKPYLTESKVTEELIKETYERLKTEVKASHILIKVQPGQDDTTKAWTKINEIRALALDGNNFDSLATTYSEDPSAKINKGSLGYFTALQMVYPFENAAFNTEIGDISEPIKTQFGYHLIKVFDSREARGRMRVAHIMIRTPRGQSAEDSTKSKQKIDAIYEEIENGSDWKQLVSDYSEDPGSKPKGGELPWFGTGNFVPAFEEQAFALDSTKIYSEPFKTVYGWHIIKYLDRKGLGSFEDMKSEIERKVGRDSRTKVKNQVVLDRIKRENSFEKNQDIVEAVITTIDSASYSDELDNKVLFKLGAKEYIAKQFKQHFDEAPGTRKIASVQYNLFEKKSIMAFENDQLEFKYPEYRALLNEYRDGILLFDVMEQLVWQKASQDSLGLAQFYESNKAKYIKRDVALADIFTAKSSNVIDSVQAMLENGVTTADIDEEMNAKDPLTLQVRQNNFAKGENSFVDKNSSIGIHRYEENKRHYLLNIKENKPEITPELKDIKGRVISDFQDHLEESWIEELKSKYTIEVDDSVFKKVISEIESSI